MIGFSTGTRLFEIPPATVLDCIIDVDRWHEWQSSLERVDILSPADGSDRPTRVRLGARVGPWLAWNVVTVTYSTTGLSWGLADSDLLRRYDGEWLVTEAGPHASTVKYRLRVVPKAFAPRFIVDPATDTEIGHVLDALEAFVTGSDA